MTNIDTQETDYSVYCQSRKRLWLFNKCNLIIVCFSTLIRKFYKSKVKYANGLFLKKSYVLFCTLIRIKCKY
jgi:hypothetical protein